MRRLATIHIVTVDRQTTTDATL